MVAPIANLPEFAAPGVAYRGNAEMGTFGNLSPADLLQMLPSSRLRPNILDWAEQNIVVHASDRAGRLHLDPYQRQPLEAFADPDVDSVVFMWSSQLGKTLMEAIMLGWVVDEDPQGMLFVHASGKGLNKFVREKLDPMLLANPDINAKVRRNNRASIPIEGFSFAEGGYCTMVTAGSRSSKHGTSASVVIADEIDDYEDHDIVSALIQRMTTFAVSTLVLASTPTMQGDSPIETEFMLGSQSEWFVPCLMCGTLQVIDESNIIDFEYLACKHCWEPWTEDDRQQSVRLGSWVEANPNARQKSYHLSQLSSLSVPIRKTLTDARRYSQQEFSTQIMASPYLEVEIEPVKPEQVIRKTRDWEVAYTTVGVDVQKNRLEYGVYQFDKRLVNKHLVHRGVILRTEGPECGHQLRDEVLKWGPMRITVDGSYTFDWVNGMLRSAFPDQFMLADPPVEIVRGYTGDSFDKPLRGGRNLGFFWGATDEAKVMIMQDLAKGFLTIDPGCPSDTENQLVSEKLIRTETQHRVRRKWVPIQGRRNEVLDCTGYAYMGVLALDLTERDSPDIHIGPGRGNNGTK